MNHLQEIDEVLMSKMTHEEEDAVQEELIKLQNEELGLPVSCHRELLVFVSADFPTLQRVPKTVTESTPISLPSAPSTEPIQGNLVFDITHLFTLIYFLHAIQETPQAEREETRIALEA